MDNWCGVREWDQVEQLWHSRRPQRPFNGFLKGYCMLSGVKHQRFISTARLKALLPLHLQPIKVVFFDQSVSSNLEVGFVLRCFQHLSLPNLATQQCPGRDSWYTRG